MITPPWTVDGFEVPVIWSIFAEQGLEAVGDIELVAGRARIDEGQRRAVDRDGIAGGKTGRDRVGGRRPGERVAALMGAGSWLFW